MPNKLQEEKMYSIPFYCSYLIPCVSCLALCPPSPTSFLSCTDPWWQMALGCRGSLQSYHAQKIRQKMLRICTQRRQKFFSSFAVNAFYRYNFLSFMRYRLCEPVNLLVLTTTLEWTMVLRWELRRCGLKYGIWTTKMEGSVVDTVQKKA